MVTRTWEKMALAGGGVLALVFVAAVGSCLRLEPPRCESDEACLAGQVCSAWGVCVPGDVRCGLQGRRGSTCGPGCLSCGGRCVFVGAEERWSKAECVSGQVSLACQPGFVQVGGVCRPEPASERIGVGGAIGKAFAVASSPGGDLYLALLDEAGQRVWLLVRRAGGGTWEKLTVLGPGDLPSGQQAYEHPLVRVTSDGIAHVIVVAGGGDAGPEILHASSELGQWTKETAPAPGGGEGWRGLRAVDAAAVGDTLLLVVDVMDATRRLVTLERSRGQWSLEEVALSSPWGSLPRLVLDSAPPAAERGGAPVVNLFFGLGNTDTITQLTWWRRGAPGAWEDASAELPPSIPSGVDDRLSGAAARDVHALCVPWTPTGNWGDNHATLLVWPGWEPPTQSIDDIADVFLPLNCEVVLGPRAETLYVAYAAKGAGAMLSVEAYDVATQRRSLLDLGPYPSSDTTPLRGIEVGGTFHLFIPVLSGAGDEIAHYWLDP